MATIIRLPKQDVPSLEKAKTIIKNQIENFKAGNDLELNLAAALVLISEFLENECKKEN